MYFRPKFSLFIFYFVSGRVFFEVPLHMWHKHITYFFKRFPRQSRTSTIEVVVWKGLFLGLLRCRGNFWLSLIYGPFIESLMSR